MNLANEPVRAVPKPVHKRKSKKWGKASEFSPSVRRAIIKRDRGLCVRCGAPYHSIHHVIFRSQGGKGTVDNGVCTCLRCHEWAHSGREGREWFERYRERMIRDENKVSQNK